MGTVGSCVFLGFWSIDLRNLPFGSVRHRQLDIGAARSLIASAREAGLLTCGSTEDLLAPNAKGARKRHAQLCSALATRLRIPIGKEDFYVTHGGCTTIFPIECAQLRPGQQLVIIDCSYRLKDRRSGDIDDLFEVAEDTITFHLFEVESSDHALPGVGDESNDAFGCLAERMQTAEHTQAVDQLLNASEAEVRSTPSEIYEVDAHHVQKILSTEAHRTGLNAVPLKDASSLGYPCTAYALFDHSATGEGRTLGLLVMHAGSAEDLVRTATAEFGDFYATGAKVGYWRGTPGGFEPLDPRIALDALDELFAD